MHRFAIAATLFVCVLASNVVAAQAWLLAGGRRREGEKYAGLRILR